MSSADTSTEAVANPADEARQALLEAVAAELGEAVVATELVPGHDLWIRVRPESWADTADYLRNRQRFRFFNWLGGIDWMPNPYGRGLDAAVDKLLGLDTGAAEVTHDEGTEVHEAPGTDDTVYATGITGGDSRFQVMARVGNLTTRIGVTLKTDVPADTMTVGSWTSAYPGADWPERETYEMYGISFAGHPRLRKLYLPTDFEGYPLRKDFPLLARLVKPWPGIVDVEPMPGSDESDTPSENQETSS